MIALCLAVAAFAAVPVPAAPAPGDTLPFVLVRGGGFARLSADPARPVEPAGLAFDSFGRVFVSDAALRRLIRFEVDGNPSAESGTLGDETGGLRKPGAVTAAGVLRMAVLDEEQRRIVSYDLQGRLQGGVVELGSALESRGGRARPVGLGSDRSGALYVADADGDRVLKFDAAGGFVRELGGPTAGGVTLRGVAGVTVARRGDLFVSESHPGRIVRLDPTGATRAAWALPDSTDAVRLPLAVDDSLRVACADPIHGRVWVFEATGILVARAEGLDRPSALAFARDGSLWVAERGARRLTRFELAPRGRPGKQ